MNRTFSLIGLAAISASIGMIGACSSSSSSDDSASGTDSGTPDSSSTLHDSGVVDTGTAADTGSGDPDSLCAGMATAEACQQCCGTNHTAGATVGENAAIACGCHGTGVDAGAGVDAGGPCATACAATLCAATPATPDTACQTCLNTQISTAAGECADYFATTCMASTDCNAEQNCFQTCPN